MAKVNEQQYAATLQEILIRPLTRNENPLKKLDRIDKPLTIKQDQQEKQVINTIREVPPEMYTPAHLLIPPQDKLSLFRKHNANAKKMPMGIIYHEFVLIATCEKTNFVHAIPMQNRQSETIANALLHRVCCLTGPPTRLSIDQDAALTSQVIKELLTSLECTMKINKSMESWQFKSRKTN